MALWKTVFLYNQAVLHFHDCFREGTWHRWIHEILLLNVGTVFCSKPFQTDHGSPEQRKFGIAPRNSISSDQLLLGKDMSDGLQPSDGLHLVASLLLHKFSW